MSKLTNSQLVALSNATQREDGAIDLPKHLKGGAAARRVEKSAAVSKFEARVDAIAKRDLCRRTTAMDRARHEYPAEFNAAYA